MITEDYCCFLFFKELESYECSQSRPKTTLSRHRYHRTDLRLFFPRPATASPITTLLWRPGLGCNVLHFVRIDDYSSRYLSSYAPDSREICCRVEALYLTELMKRSAHQYSHGNDTGSGVNKLPRTPGTPDRSTETRKTRSRAVHIKAELLEVCSNSSMTESNESLLPGVLDQGHQLAATIYGRPSLKSSRFWQRVNTCGSGTLPCSSRSI